MCNQDIALQDEQQSESDSFPWHLGLADTHCHPLEYPASLSSQSLSRIKTQTLAVLATRLEDQTILHEIALQHPGKEARIIPGFGWHPWFSHLLYNDLAEADDNELSSDQVRKHYSEVLTPPAPESFSSLLPKPTRLSCALSQLRTHLQAHPLALLGEVGLDKAFRVPEPWADGTAPDQAPNSPPRPHLQGQQTGEDDKGQRTAGGRWRRGLSRHRVSLAHQKTVLVEQMKVAAELQRPASVHGVQTHGALFELVKGMCESDEQHRADKSSRKNVSPETTVEPSKPRKFPPRICLHSYSGTPSSLVGYFPKSSSDALPIKFYVSFSTPNNFRTPLSQTIAGGEVDTASARAVDCIKLVPSDRILVESDLHSAGRDADAMLADVVHRVCVARDWEVEEGVKRLQANWLSFAFGESQ